MKAHCKTHMLPPDFYIPQAKTNFSIFLFSTACVATVGGVLAQSVRTALCHAVQKFCTTLISSPPAVLVEVNQNKEVI